MLALGLALTLIFCLSAVALAFQAIVLSGRAATAADLAALAAADVWRGLKPGEPCTVARNVAAMNGADVSRCSTASDFSVEIDTVLRQRPLVGIATGRSRAGPPPGDQGPYLTGPAAAGEVLSTVLDGPAASEGLWAFLSSTSSSMMAPALSRGLFLLPHLGDWTQDGQPDSHSHALMAARVAASQVWAFPKARSANPAPPGWPS